MKIKVRSLHVKDAIPIFILILILSGVKPQLNRCRLPASWHLILTTACDVTEATPPMRGTLVNLPSSHSRGDLYAASALWRTRGEQLRLARRSDVNAPDRKMLTSWWDLLTHTHTHRGTFSDLYLNTPHIFRYVDHFNFFCIYFNFTYLISEVV